MRTRAWLWLLAFAGACDHASIEQAADAGSPPAFDAAGPADAGPPPPPTNQAYVWIWRNYGENLDTVIAHADSFTHVSPALYHVNYDYQSGPARLLNEDDDFDGLSAAEICQRAHEAQLRCEPLVYAGAGNSGTDVGIHHILDDSPAGARQSFIDGMIEVAQANGFDGFNLDWEVDGESTNHDGYGDKWVAFLSAFKGALNAQGMTLSIDIGTWYIRQSECSGGGGVADLTTLGDAVDLAIIMAYTNTLGPAAEACPAPVATPVACDNDMEGQLALMCLLPPSTVAIGLIDPGTGPIADDAFAAIHRYGFHTVALWPDEDPFLGGTDWYSRLADHLGR
jgi:hypothetical protein